MVAKAKKILYNIENGEFGLREVSLKADGAKGSEPGSVQMDLFRKPDSLILDRLKKVDLSKMTPLEALNFLNDLQDVAKAGK